MSKKADLGLTQNSLDSDLSNFNVEGTDCKSRCLGRLGQQQAAQIVIIVMFSGHCIDIDYYMIQAKTMQPTSHYRHSNCCLKG